MLYPCSVLATPGWPHLRGLLFLLIFCQEAGIGVTHRPGSLVEAD